MHGLLTVALVCAATLAPADCTRETALDVLVQPAASEVACLLGGETMVAGGAFGADRRADTYLKIGCERRKAPAARPSAEGAAR